MNTLCRLTAFALLLGIAGSTQARSITSLSPDEIASPIIATRIDLKSGIGADDYQTVSGSVKDRTAQSATADDLSFSWGSVDSDGSIRFYMNNAVVAGFDGDQSSDTNHRLSSDKEFFDSVRSAREGLAFESDNTAFTIVPQPGTVVLLALGLLGLGFARRQQQRVV